VHREFVVLVLLAAVVVVGFLLTRAAAHANHERRLRDGRAWFATAERELAAGRSESAIAALRRAAAIDRDNRQYRLSLAKALVTARQDAAARQVLIGMREFSPEDPEVNLQLARLAGRQGDMAGASRFYQNALSGTWDADQQKRRRQLRVEFVRYLLTQDQRTRALSELLILSGNVPDEVAAHVEAGELFLAASDSGRALDHFRRALRLDATSRTALAGAGEAAFELGDYTAARRFLLASNPAASNPRFRQLNELREVADLVLERDPLRPRLSRRDRRDRLMADVEHAHKRLQACIAAPTPLSQSKRSQLESLRTEIIALERALRRRFNDRSVEHVEEGLSLVYRIEYQTTECSASLPLDRALLLIGKRHGLDLQ
jgi:tetratricopeptide (TPR) repeat protein